MSNLLHQNQVYRIASILVSLLFVLLAYIFQIPNPMMLLILPVIYFTFSEGYIAGALSAVIVGAYGLWFFSTPGHFFVYDTVNVQKVVMIVIALMVTVTLIGNLKARLLAMEAKEAAVKARNDFLSRMSHDIRTPLNGILGMTRLAQGEPDPTVVRGYLSKIADSGHYLLGLVNDILDMAAIEGQKVKLYTEPYKLEEFCSYLDAVIQPLCDYRNITFVKDFGAWDKRILCVDKLRFNQVFTNLLSNAVKCTPRGGRVELKLESYEQRGNFMDVTLAVIDNGIGMSEAFLQRLFTPFEHERNALTNNEQSTGLGLSIVHNLVTLAGGTIQVQSKLGAGTTFRVQLPHLPVLVEDAKAAPLVRTKHDLTGLRVLLCEDNEINAQIVQVNLEQQHVDVLWAKDGAEAVRIFEQEPVESLDAILMDIRMPHVDGLEATRRIRALTRTDAAKIPIIALTADAFSEDVESVLAAGMNEHLAKPVDMAYLFQVLARLTGR